MSTKNGRHKNGNGFHTGWQVNNTQGFHRGRVGVYNAEEALMGNGQKNALIDAARKARKILANKSHGSAITNGLNSSEESDEPKPLQVKVVVFPEQPTVNSPSALIDLATRQALAEVEASHMTINSFEQLESFDESNRSIAGLAVKAMSMGALAKNAVMAAYAAGSGRENIVNNWETIDGGFSRAGILQYLLDGPKNIDAECGYAPWLTADHYRVMYDREGVAARVVEIEPKETWAITPEIYDDEDPKEETKFEKDLKDLVKTHNIYHYMQRVDVLSGIGQFGVLLIGINDGLSLDQPVQGVQPDGTWDKKKRDYDLLYLRPFSEAVCFVRLRETNTNSLRYGLPILYTIHFRDFPDYGVQAGEIVARDVHWTRIIHVADNLKESPIYGIPRMQQVWNRLIDLRKTYAASGEAYWKTGFPLLSFETMPEFADQGVGVDQEAMKRVMEKVTNGLQRYVATVGLSAKTLPPGATPPAPFTENALEAIAITKGIPKRIMFGSEQAVLASDQDARAWIKRLRNRQEHYVTPCIIRPFIDRLIVFGILSPPKDGDYQVHWADLATPTDLEKAQIGAQLTTALQGYVQGGVNQLIEPADYFSMVLKFDPSEIEKIQESFEAQGQEPGEGQGQDQESGQPQQPPGNQPPGGGNSAADSQDLASSQDQQDKNGNQGSMTIRQPDQGNALEQKYLSQQGVKHPVNPPITYLPSINTEGLTANIVGQIERILDRMLDGKNLAANKGTSEGVKKEWESRQRGSSPSRMGLKDGVLSNPSPGELSDFWREAKENVPEDRKYYSESAPLRGIVNKETGEHHWAPSHSNLHAEIVGKVEGGNAGFEKRKKYWNVVMDQHGKLDNSEIDRMVNETSDKLDKSGWDNQRVKGYKAAADSNRRVLDHIREMGVPSEITANREDFKDGHWVTIHGVHVEIREGKVVKGPDALIGEEGNNLHRAGLLSHKDKPPEEDEEKETPTSPSLDYIPPTGDDEDEKIKTEKGLKETSPGEIPGTMADNLDENGNWHKEREKLHLNAIHTMTDKADPVDSPTVTMMGGGTASGKSTLINGGHVDVSNHVKVDSDKIKERYIPEYKKMLVQGDKLAAAYTHEESSHLAKMTAAYALMHKKNVIFDGTGDTSVKSLQKKVDAFRKAGATRISAEYTTCPISIAMSRAKARAEKKGRTVPDQVAKRTHRAVAKMMPDILKNNIYDELRLWDTREDGKPKMVLEHRNGKTTIHEPELYRQFLSRATQDD